MAILQGNNVAQHEKKSNGEMIIRFFLVLYFSDIFFIKTKIDNAKRTGTGRGNKVILTETDNLVLDIIGSNSSLLLGIGVSCSLL